MSGGTLNRIICITVIDPSADRPEQLILRIPRIAWMSRPDREVATLRYVRQHSSVPVPPVKAFDFKPDISFRTYMFFNAGLLGQTFVRPYRTIQAMSSGVQLRGRLVGYCFNFKQ